MLQLIRFSRETIPAIYEQYMVPLIFELYAAYLARLVAEAGAPANH